MSSTEKKTKGRSVGRPCKGESPYSVNLQVRVTKETADTCKAMGGADFLRPVIESAVKAVNEEQSPKKEAAAAAVKNMPSIYKPAANDPMITFVDMTASCGFPSPAFDYEAKELSLNDYFIRHQDATYIVEAKGDSMIDAGIQEGDLLIIDRSVEPRSGDIVLAVINAEFTLKRLRIVDGEAQLHPENQAADYPVLRPSEFDDFSIEGVLVGSGRKYRSQ